MGDEDVAHVVSGAASSVGCAHTLKLTRQKMEVKAVSFIVVCSLVNSCGERGRRLDFQFR